MKRLIIGAMVTVVLIRVALMLVFRVRPPGLMNALRRFNRDVVNPKVIDGAGSEDSNIAVLHHVGRDTGRRYDTPVLAAPTDIGFVVPLPYGTGVDWLRNVLASGGCTMELAGTPYVVINPRVVSAESEDVVMAPSISRRMRPFGVDEYLQVDRLDSIYNDDALDVA